LGRAESSRSANFQEAHLKKANLRNADLSGLDLGKAILDEADALDGDGDDPLVKARIAFLREGLVHLRKVRDMIDLAYREELPEGMLLSLRWPHELYVKRRQV